MSILERIGNHVMENKDGMMYDIMFAVVWVAMISFLFDFVFVSAPTWAYYMFMLAGIPAYFGFFFSLELVKNLDQD